MQVNVFSLYSTLYKMGEKKLILFNRITVSFSSLRIYLNIPETTNPHWWHAVESKPLLSYFHPFYFAIYLFCEPKRKTHKN